MSWWFQAVSNPITTFRTPSASSDAASTQIAGKDASTTTTARRFNRRLIALPQTSRNLHLRWNHRTSYRSVNKQDIVDRSTAAVAFNECEQALKRLHSFDI